MRMKIEFAPEYSISQIFNKQAEECKTGMVFFAMTLPNIIASLKVQSPD